MYIEFNFENMITIGIMLLIWMLCLHLLGQAGVSFAPWLTGKSA